MNPTLLIQAIVRQTMVLVATLATASGQRAQLASVANLVFADLVRELREQGVGNKVIADMFGMALRTYHRKLTRLSESRTVSGQSLWEAVLGHVQARGPLLRSELVARFANDDEAVVRAVIVDLIESGLVRREGTRDATRLEAAPLPGALAAEDPRTLEAMVLVALYRHGPVLTKRLLELVPCDERALEATLARMLRDGMISASTRGGETSYTCESCVIPFGDAAGWEAAVFDHYQALVVALVTKLRAGARRAALGDRVGGSTFGFDLWEGHPMADEVLGFLRATRERGIALRERLEKFNADNTAPAEAQPLRVTAYVGQSVIEGGGDDGEA